VQGVDHNLAGREIRPPWRRPRPCGRRLTAGRTGDYAGEVTDPDQLRISDADRHQVAEVLRQAAGEGRLDLDELDERLEATYAAKVYADLVPIVVDLPTSQLDLPAAALPEVRRANFARPPGSLPATRHDTSVAIMSGQDRKGVWEVGPTHTAFTLMGGVDIDLREAVFATPEVVITANAIMGGIDIIVNQRTRVVVEGIGIMGAFDQARDRVEAQLDAHSPLVRVKGIALMGAVTVIRRPMPGEKGSRRRRMLGH
jgi:uncharacterized protein YjeT (DUF2065 family)